MSMFRLGFTIAGAAFAAAVLLAGPAALRGQEPPDRELTARARVLPGVGAGVKALRRDASGRYYVLGSAGNSVSIYAADGKPAGQVPKSANRKKPEVVFAEDFDVDLAGDLYFADRGANAIEVFGPDGHLRLTIAIAEPVAISALASGEIAVASVKTRHLVDVFDMHGKLVREFGDRFEVAEHEQLNHLLNGGQLASDAANHIYFAFTYVPEPTIRKHDRFGYALLDLTLTSLAYEPAATAARREIARQDERDASPLLKPVIGAIGVDPQTEEVWARVGLELLQFSPDGSRRIVYRAYTADGVRVDACAILVEPQRLLLVSSALGIFEFARPPSIKNANP
jgi:hypothetical protein